MSTATPNGPAPQLPRKKHAASHFFFKGLAITLPPILTIVILIWLARGVNDYVIRPISTGVQFGFAQLIDASVPFPSPALATWDRLPPLDYVGRDYVISRETRERLQELATPGPTGEISKSALEFDEVYVPMGNRAVPYTDYREIARRVRMSEMPASAVGLYMEIVTVRYFRSLLNLSAVAVVLTVVGVYFIGRVVTIRLGAWIVGKVETGVLGRLPLVRNVYSSVKQVTDFVFSERQVEYSRVVVLQYPRRGIWSIGFVTGDAMSEVSAAAGEPCVSVLIPSSPMPVTGYTIQVPRTEIVDLNLTIDQAFQFCISCGVLVPPQQRVVPDAGTRGLEQLPSGKQVAGIGSRASGDDLEDEP